MTFLYSSIALSRRTVSLLYGYVLTFEAIEGGHVSIEKLP